MGAGLAVHYIVEQRPRGMGAAERAMMGQDGRKNPDLAVRRGFRWTRSLVG